MVELSESARAFLSEPRFAVAATIGSDGMPHQTVVWFLLEGDEVIVNMPQGSAKHKNLLRTPQLSLCIEDGFRYVTLAGSVTLHDDPGRALYGRLGQHYMGGAAARPATPPDDPKLRDLLSRERITVRMKIERAIVNGLN